MADLDQLWVHSFHAKMTSPKCSTRTQCLNIMKPKFVCLRHSLFRYQTGVDVLNWLGQFSDLLANLFNECYNSY